MIAAGVVPSRLRCRRIDAELGTGGQGVVVLATDPELDPKVAIKLLWASGREARALLLREGRALARLEHPNVVRVFDVGEIATLVEAGRGLAAAHGDRSTNGRWKQRMRSGSARWRTSCTTSRRSRSRAAVGCTRAMRAAPKLRPRVRWRWSTTRRLVATDDAVLAGELAAWLAAPRGAKVPERPPPR